MLSNKKWKVERKIGSNNKRQIFVIVGKREIEKGKNKNENL